MFWSADSRFIVYAAGGKLVRAPVAGGSQQTVGDRLPLTVAAGYILYVLFEKPVLDFSHRVDFSLFTRRRAPTG